ncbi:MerR family transcriptional regulator [Streptomyces zhihengii]
MPGDDAEQADDSAGLTTGELAGRLGVAPTTIRSWGRRYGLEPAAHTPGGHRRWSPADVARLERMRALTSTGLAPAEAALLVRGGPAEAPRFARRAAAETAHPEEGAATGAVAAGAAEAAPPLPVGPDGPVGPVGPGADGPDHVDGLDRPDPADRGDRPSTAGRPHRGDRPSTAGRPDGPDRPGGLDHLPDGPLTGPGAPTAERPDLVRAALRLDSAAMDAILRAALASHGVVGAWDQVITPALRAVGRLWETSGERYIDIEHALTWHVSGALGRCVPRAPTGGARPPCWRACRARTTRCRSRRSPPRWPNAGSRCACSAEPFPPSRSWPPSGGPVRRRWGCGPSPSPP